MLWSGCVRISLSEALEPPGVPGQGSMTTKDTKHLSIERYERFVQDFMVLTTKTVTYFHDLSPSL